MTNTSIQNIIPITLVFNTRIVKELDLDPPFSGPTKVNIMLKEFVQWSKFIGSFRREIIQLAGMSNVASYLQNGQV